MVGNLPARKIPHRCRAITQLGAEE